MGVIDKNTGELRSTYDILQDLSKAWGNLTSVEKQELTETVAGKTQRALFTAIMTNFQTAVDATTDALNSENSASEENAKRMDSLNGKVQQLQSAWQSLSRDTINNEFIKSILEAGTNLLKFANTDVGKTITTIIALVAGVKLLTTGLNLAKTAILTNGQALFQYLLILQGVPAAQAAASASSLGLVGSLKILTTALVTNPVFLAIAAFSALAVTFATVSQKAKEAREASKNLAKDRLKEAKEAQNSLDTYEKLSKATNNSKEDNKKLSKTIKDLSEKYGVSEDALKSEGEERDKAIKKIKDEIVERKKAAATASESGIDWKKLNLTGSRTEKEAVTSRDAVEIQDKLSKKYDLTADTVAGLQKKIQGYITTLQNKNNKTKEEEKDLNSLLSMYNKMSNSLTTYKEGYSQTLQNYKDGIPLTTEQGNALYQLGEITLNEAVAIQGYNDYISKNTNLTDEQKEKVWEATQVFIENKKQLDENGDGTSTLTAKQKELNEQLDDNQSKIDNTNKSLDNLQTAYKTLTTAVDEYNSDGYLSIDTLQSLLSLSDDYLSALSMENGQLVLNTSALDDKTNALIAQRISLLQTSAMNDLYNLSIGNTEALSDTAQKAIGNLGSDVGDTKTKMENAIPTMETFNQKLRETAAAYGITSEEGQKQAESIIGEYDKLFKKITQLGGSTSKAGGTGGSRHRYTGKSTGGKKSGGSKSTKSTKEEYKATIDTLYNYKNALDNAKESVDKLQDALKNTDNYNEQEKYINKLIDATNNEINKTNELKDAQTSQINDYINQLRAQGFAIDYNSSKNELYINNMQHLADLSGDNAKAVEKLLDKIQDLNDNNRSLDSSVRDLTSDTKDYYDQLADIPEQKLKKFNELMEDFQQSRLDQIQNQIDDIQHEMDNDERIKAIEKQIKALEKQNDELDNQKELEEKLLAVEEAKIKLQNAQKQRNMMVYRENQGWVWESDPDAIRDAAQDLKDAQDDLNDKIKQDQIDQLKAEKEALEKSYQDRIDALENFLDEQNYLIDKANREGAQTFDELRKELAKFGLDSAEYLGKATDWLNNYNKSLAELNETVGGILSSSSQATDGMIYSSAVQDRIDQALSSLIPSITPSTGLTLSNIDFDKIKGIDKGQSIYINNIELPNVQDIDDFVAALRDLPNMATSQSSQRN